MKVTSDKLERTISSMRLKSSTDDTILEMAKKKRRDKKEFIRLTLDIVTERYRDGKWDYEHLY